MLDLVHQPSPPKGETQENMFAACRGFLYWTQANCRLQPSAGGKRVKPIPRILQIGDQQQFDSSGDANPAEIVIVQNAAAALDLLAHESFSEIRIAADGFEAGRDLLLTKQGDDMLRDMPDGVALVDDQRFIMWANRRLETWA